MKLLLELLTLGERIYAKEGELIISVQHTKESSNEEAISTFLRRNPFQTHLSGAKDVDIYSLLNYVSSAETTKLLQSLKGKGPYKLKPQHYTAFIRAIAEHAGGILTKLKPDTVILPKSSSDFIRDFAKELKTAYPKAQYFPDALVKKVLDAENIEPLLNKEHPDWPQFEIDHPKEVRDLRRSLVKMIKTNGQLEAKTIYKQYAKFIKNFIELQSATDILNHLIDKRVLIIDDILSSGVTMVDMIREINDLEAKQVLGFTIFKRTSAIKEGLKTSIGETEVMKLANEFRKEYEGETGKKEFGCSLKELHDEGGNCSMISHEFCKWAEKRGIKAVELTGDTPTNSKWNNGHKGTYPSNDLPPEIASHTVAQIGMWTIDFNARQFDKKLPYPRIIEVGDFDEEWEKVI